MESKRPRDRLSFKKYQQKSWYFRSKIRYKWRTFTKKFWTDLKYKLKSPTVGQIVSNLKLKIERSYNINEITK